MVRIRGPGIGGAKGLHMMRPWTVVWVWQGVLRGWALRRRTERGRLRGIASSWAGGGSISFDNSQWGDSRGVAVRWGGEKHFVVLIHAMATHGGRTGAGRKRV